MKVLIIYDSVFGNTEQIALSIGNALSFQAEVNILRVGDVKQENLRGLDMLIVGSPTRAFRPTKAIINFLKGIPQNGLKGVKVSAFDTRFTMEKIKSSFFMLPLLVNIFGYAAKPIVESSPYVEGYSTHPFADKKSGKVVKTSEFFKRCLIRLYKLPE